MATGKKNSTRLGAHLIFVDESGFLLTPIVRKTWAPVGQTPIIRHRYRNDRISVIAGITASPVRSLFSSLELVIGPFRELVCLRGARGRCHGR